MATTKVYTEVDVVDALNIAANYLKGKGVEVDVAPSVPQFAGVGLASNGADALANVRAYCDPITGRPQYTDAAGRHDSDDRWSRGQNLPELQHVPKDTLEIVLRSNGDGVQLAIPSAFVPFQYSGQLDNVTSDAWVNDQKSKKGLPSG